MLRGKLKGSTVSRIIDLLARSRKTGRLAMADGSNARGKLYFRDGKITAAETENAFGKAALEDLIAWKEVYFEFQEDLLPPQEDLLVDADALLLRCQAQRPPG